MTSIHYYVLKLQLSTSFSFYLTSLVFPSYSRLDFISQTKPLGSVEHVCYSLDAFLSPTINVKHSVNNSTVNHVMDCKVTGATKLSYCTPWHTADVAAGMTLACPAETNVYYISSTLHTNYLW